MKTHLLSTTFAGALLLSTSAMAEVSIEQVTDILAATGSDGGSVLPLPFTGATPIVAEAEGSITAIYPALDFMGLGIEDLVVEFADAGDGLVAISSQSYTLSQDLAYLWEETVIRGDLPRFSGTWNIADAAFDDFTFGAALTIGEAGFAEISGTLSIDATRGETGGLSATLSDVTGFIDGGSVGVEIAHASLGLTGTDARGVDPAYLISYVQEVVMGGNASPFALLGLGQELLSSEIALSFDAEGVAIGDSTEGLTVEDMSLLLAKSGTDPRGALGLDLTIAGTGGRLATYDPYEDRPLIQSFDTIGHTQSLSVTDLPGLVAKSPQFRNLFNVYGPAQLRDAFVTLISTLDAANFAYTSAYQGTGIELDLPDSTSVSAENFASALTLNPEQELSFSLSGEGLSMVADDWEYVNIGIQDGDMLAKVAIDPSLLGNLAAFGKSLELDLIERMDREGANALPDLLASLPEQLEIFGIAPSFEMEMNGVNFGFIDDYSGFGFNADALGYRLGMFQSAAGNPQFDYDLGAEGLILADLAGLGPAATRPAYLRSLIGSGDESLILSLASVSSDLDLEVKPLNPFITELLAIAKRASTAELTDDFASYRPFIEDASLAALNQFERAVASFEISDLEANAYEAERSYNSRAGGSLASATFAYGISRQEGPIFAMNVDQALFDARAIYGPLMSLGGFRIENDAEAFPDGLGANLISFYLDMMEAAIDYDYESDEATGPTWGDYARAIMYDTTSALTAELDDFTLIAPLEEFTFVLPHASMATTGTATTSPMALSQQVSIDHSGLSLTSGHKPTDAYLRALLPHDGVLTFGMNMGVDADGLAALDSIVMINQRYDESAPRQQADALAALDFSLSLEEFALNSSTYSLVSSGGFAPKMLRNSYPFANYWDNPFAGLDVEPNLSLTATVEGLAALEQATSEFSKYLGQTPYYWLEEMVWNLPDFFAFLREYGDNSAEDILTYEASLQSFETGEMRINGQSFP